MPKRRRRRAPLLASVVLAALAAGLVWFQLSRPLPAVAAQPAGAASTTLGTTPLVPWPADGIAALGATEVGLVQTGPSQRPLPMYSVAKVMTALQVLADHPLKPGEQGPSVTMTATDVQNFQRRKAAEESVVDVAAGEQLTEYQLLQALLIPSGNNIGDVLATWDAGSVPAFIEKLNARARLLAMTQTTYADPSGADEKTAATPGDLARQAAVAAADPVIADIASQPQVELPVAGVRYNVDYALGQGGIAGLKTGSGNGSANFMFASPLRVAGKQLTIVGAVMGLPTLDEAFAVAQKLIAFAKQNVSYVQVVAAGDVVARYAPRWQAPVGLRAQQAVLAVAWPGIKVERRLKAAPARVPEAAGSAAGTLEVTVGGQQLTVPLATDRPVLSPGRRWRLTRLT